MTTNTVPGISALQCVISSLRDTAHLSDEGGELTDQLRELRDWALSTAAQPAVQQGEPLAWMDDGTLRVGSEATAYRVVTDATKRGMTASLAANFITPLYAHPAAPAAQGDALDAEVKEMREALIDAAAHLIGAASAYEKYAKRFGGIKPKAVIDPFFETRHMDFHEAAGRAQAYLNKARWKHD